MSQESSRSDPAARKSRSPHSSSPTLKPDCLQAAIFLRARFRRRTKPEEKKKGSAQTPANCLMSYEMNSYERNDSAKVTPPVSRGQDNLAFYPPVCQIICFPAIEGQYFKAEPCM